MPSTKYGRILVDHSLIRLMGENGEGAASNGTLIAVSTPNFLGIQAGINGGWAGVMVIIHEPQDLHNPSEEEVDWEDSMETTVTFFNPPFFHVDVPPGYGVDPALQSLGIPKGTYRIAVKANGLHDSFEKDDTPGKSFEALPPPDKVHQQIRIDLWKTQDPPYLAELEGMQL